MDIGGNAEPIFSIAFYSPNQKVRHCLTFWFELLSWNHYIELLRIDDPHERLFYEKEAENFQSINI